MARTFRAAVAAVEGRDFDFAVGYAVPPRRHAPVDEGMGRNFAHLDYRPYRQIARNLARRQRRDEADGEDAVQQGFLEMLEKEPHRLREEPARWQRDLFRRAQHALGRSRRRRWRVLSIEALIDARGDPAFADAEPCLPVASSTEERGTLVSLPEGGRPWTTEQAIAAFQRFRDHHGRPPVVADCQRLHLLPSPSVVRRLFGGHERAVLAAGMTPRSLGQRRRRWTAVEAARACRSFRRRNGRWPDSGDLGRDPGDLPSAGVMVRIFGSTRAAVVQARAEAILASVEGSRGGGVR